MALAPRLSEVLEASITFGLSTFLVLLTWKSSSQ